MKPEVLQITGLKSFRDAFVADRISRDCRQVGHERVAMHVVLIAPIAPAHEPGATFLGHVGRAVAALEPPIKVVGAGAAIVVAAPGAGHGAWETTCRYVRVARPCG